MRYGFSLLLFLALAFTTTGYAQESAAESVEKLRAQLLEVQMQEHDLRSRLAQLDESIKPENIERSLAGVGSTRPEELREARRRQLAIERESVKAQLKLLEISRMRLDSAIASAEGRAYQESALPAPSPPINALHIEAIGSSPVLVAILAVSLVVSLATVLLTLKGASR